MKHLIFLLAALAMGMLAARAQDSTRIFKRFKGDVSMGYAKPVSSGSSGGILFAMEPKLAIIDQLSVGLRIEGAVMARYVGNDIYGFPLVEDEKGSASYVATADYYFTKNYSFRPFVGVGAGVFGLIADDENLDDDPVSAVKFGGIVRVGGEVKHFRFGFEYNIIPDTEITSYDYQGMLTKVKSKNGYFGIKAGVCFGGAPR